jgi:hypothetical protein
MRVDKLKSENHSEKDKEVLQKMCDLNNEMQRRISSSNWQRENSLAKKDRARKRKLINEFLKEENSNHITKDGKVICSGRNTDFVFGMIDKHYLESECA